MKVAFVTQWKPDNRTAYSGTSWFMRQALIEAESTFATLARCPDFGCVQALAALASLATASPSAAAPCVGIRVEPGDKLQRIISAAPLGATICSAPGIYELPRPFYPVESPSPAASPCSSREGAMPAPTAQIHDACCFVRLLAIMAPIQISCTTKTMRMPTTTPTTPRFVIRG